MQRYQSHKIVEAAKIHEAIVSRQPDDDVVLELEGADDPMSMQRDVWNRLSVMADESGFPIIGGWVVVYDGGTPKQWISWSPAEPFEEGYDLVQPSSGKSKIAGYRELTAEEIDLMNVVKMHGKTLGDLIEHLRTVDSLDQRWVSMGATDLQKGLMGVTRAIAKPEFF